MSIVNDGRRTPTDDGRRTDGRRLDGYTISSPCEPNGSGELKKALSLKRPPEKYTRFTAFYVDGYIVFVFFLFVRSFIRIIYQKVLRHSLHFLKWCITQQLLILSVQTHLKLSNRFLFRISFLSL